MSLGANIAIGIGSAFVFRMLSNAAFQATLPQVDPAMPSAGPALAAAAVPGVAGGIAMAYKYNKTAAALFGIAVGAGISTAEYMSYAKAAQVPSSATLPAGESYTWILVHADGSLEKVAAGAYNLADVAAQDSAIVNKYGADPDIIQIVRKTDSSGAQAVLLKKSLPANPGIVPPQSGAVLRMIMRR